MENKKKIKKVKKEQIKDIPGLSIDDLEGTLDEIRESENQTIREEIDKAKGS